MRTFVIGDIHGEYENLQTLMAILREKAGFSLVADELVQLGDKNDRGEQTFEVFEAFRLLKQTHPDNVHLIWGNHEDMMLKAANSVATGSYGLIQDTFGLLCANGGYKTIQSYYKACGMGEGTPYHHLAKALDQTQHSEFLGEHLLFLETENYFFSHAPIPLPGMRGDGDTWQTEKETLIWSYYGEDTKRWVDPNLISGKTAVYGHIHGLKMNPNTGECESPGIRRYGSSFLIDTGSGCHPNGYLTCLELPALRVYTSRGEVYDLCNT